MRDSKVTGSKDYASWSSSLFGSIVRTASLVLASALLYQLTLTSQQSYLWSNIKNFNRSLQYHGQDMTSNFFEGWYFKMVKDNQDQDGKSDKTRAMAIIVGIYRPPTEAADQSRAHAFVIPLGLPGPEKYAYYRFTTEDFVDLGSHAKGEESAFRVRIGDSIFAYDEVILNLPVENFERISPKELESFYNVASSEYEAQYINSAEGRARPLPKTVFRDFFPSSEELDRRAQQEPFAIKGHFKFPAQTQTPLPRSILVPTIMGAAHYLPFLECNHGVASLHHPILKGNVATLYSNDSIVAEATFDGGVGYIEKDWGINFPSTWIWTQTNIFKHHPGSSLMISLASVPILGPDLSDWIKKNLPMASSLTNIPGMLIVYYHAASKTLYNFSTYMPLVRISTFNISMDVGTRTQTLSLKATARDPHNVFEKVSLEVTVTREMGTGAPLRAPNRAKGRMVTAVEETVLAKTRIKLWHVRSGETIVEDEGVGSGLEIVGDIQWLQAKINP